MTDITLVDYSESQLATIDMPAGIAAGDIAVLLDVATNTTTAPTSVYPSGCTPAGSSASDVSGGLGVRYNVSYKVLTGSETTLTGMDGDQGTTKVLLVYRNASGGSWVTGSFSAEASASGSVSPKTITVGTAPLVSIGVVVGIGGYRLDMDPAPGATIQSTDSITEVGYTIFDSSPVNSTVDATGIALAIAVLYIGVLPPSDGTATGTSTVTGAGVAFKTGAGAATGTATVSAVGAPRAIGVGAASGTATVSAGGSALLLSIGGSTGVATIAATGTGVIDAAGASPASATVEAVGGSIAEAAGAAAGAASVAAVGSVFFVGIGASSASATGTAAGLSTAASVGEAFGTSESLGDIADISAHGIASASGEAVGVGLSTAAADGTASASATVAGDGLAIFIGVGTSSGTATVSAVGSGINQSDGAATGTATVVGDGTGIVNALGACAGDASALAVGTEIYESAGASSAAADVLGIGGSIATSTGAASATADATAEGLGTAASVGASTGTATVGADGAPIFTADGASSASATVSGAGTWIIDAAGAVDASATVAAIGSSVFMGDGAASATATVSAVGSSTARTDGTSAVASAALARGVRLSLNGDNRAAQIVRQHGRTMVLRRASEGTVIALVGKPVSSSVAAVDLTGSARQQMLRIKIGPTEIEGSSWTSPAPARDDIIDLGGRTRAVKNVRPIRHNGRVQLYELTLAG